MLALPPLVLGCIALASAYDFYQENEKLPMNEGVRLGTRPELLPVRHIAEVTGRSLDDWGKQRKKSAQAGGQRKVLAVDAGAARSSTRTEEPAAAIAQAS